jgi:hypothetical protein
MTGTIFTALHCTARCVLHAYHLAREAKTLAQFGGFSATPAHLATNGMMQN